MPDFYALEGLDGVGKSSVARALAERKDAEYLRCPPNKLDSIREWIDNDQRSTETKFLLYLGGNSAVSDEIRRELEEGNDVILDRYYPTTVAYHAIEMDQDLLSVVDETNLIEPDEFIYLEADQETRNERISSRDASKRGEDDFEFISQVETQYNDLIQELDMVEVEAVEGIDNVVDRIIEEVECHG